MTTQVKHNVISSPPPHHTHTHPHKQVPSSGVIVVMLAVYGPSPTLFSAATDILYAVCGCKEPITLSPMLDR